MRVLMLTPYLPYPPSSGGQIRSYNLIKELSKEHQITLCSLIKFDSEKKYIKKLEPYCSRVYVFKRPEKAWTLKNILRTGFSSWPFLVIRNYSPSEKKALKEIVKEGFDIIHAETFYVSPHIPKTKIPVVLVDQTIEYQVYKHYVDNYRLPFLKPLLLIDVAKLKYWETFYWKKASSIVAVSDQDARVMRYLVKGLKVTVIPNGVGEDFIEDVNLHFNKTILFQGNYAWLQNAEAARILAREVFPKIKEKLPEVKLLISGQNTEVITDLKTDSISILDLAVDDIYGVKKAFVGSGVLVAPLHGPGGTRLKILSAMAARLPVVTTKVGIAGIGRAGQDYLEGESADELANLTVKLLSNRKLYKRIADNARKLVEEEYSYNAIARKLDEVYMEAKN